MGFTSKRGRPKTVTLVKGREEKDLGTLELQMRRARDMTTEPIDICKKKSIIKADQYSAAMHFRWLYTIRLGAPGVSAVNLDAFGGRNIAQNNEEWQAGREKEYAMAVEKLRQAGALRIVMNICVFNHMPRFLKMVATFSGAEMRQNIAELAKFRDGLDILARLFNPAHKKLNSEKLG